MSSRLAFQTQLASIMEVLANAAVAEICKLVDDDYAVISLQMTQCQRENKALKRKLHLLELKMARGNAERRLRESGAHSGRSRVQITTGDRLRQPSPSTGGGVFERQMDIALWSGRATAGDTAVQQTHSDSIQCKSPDAELMQPEVVLVKREIEDANMSQVEEMDEALTLIGGDEIQQIAKREDCHLNMLLRVLFGGEQKYVRLSDLTFDAFMKEVCLKFNIPEDRQLDMKVFDHSDTEVDAEVFEEIVTESPGTFRVMLSDKEPCESLSSFSTSDNAIILNFTACDPPEEAAATEGNQPKRPCYINNEAKALIENILTTKLGGEQIMQEYAKNKSLTDATRRQMIKILATEMTETHGTSPPKSIRVMYAQGIVALFPYLEDPYSQHGYEHYYDPESGSGYLAWRLKTIQRKYAEERKFPARKCHKIGGPGHGRSRPFTTDIELSDEDVEAAIAVLRQTADEDTIREKMKATFIYRHKMVNDKKKAADVFSVFPRFLDTPGLIEQDFRLLFGEVIANKFLERWPTNLKAKVVRESHGLVTTTELLELMASAKSTATVESGWDSDMSAILLLLHLLPPSAQGRKRPGKMSASQAVDKLVKFLKAGTNVQQHLDNITQSSQPYLLAQGPTRSSIQTFNIVIGKHALPCKATDSVGALDELFKAHYVFGTSYSSSLTNFFTFLQTTVYNIDVGETKETPRVAELRARMVR